MPSTNIVTELFPSVSSKRLAWYVGVVAPGWSSSPGISLRPSSPIRHTYTTAVGRSASATSSVAGARWRATAAFECLELALPCVTASVELPVVLLGELPPVISSTTSSTITAPIALTAIRKPREEPPPDPERPPPCLVPERPPACPPRRGEPERVRGRLLCGVETIGSSIASLGRSWWRRYSSTSAFASRSSACAYVRRKLLTNVGPGNRPHSSFS